MTTYTHDEFMAMVKKRNNKIIPKVKKGIKKLFGRKK